MSKFYCFVIGLAVGLMFAISPTKAHAAYPPVSGWTSPAQMAPVATICFETGGGRVLGPAIVAAAAGWNKSDLTVVAKVSCIGYARTATVKFVAYYSTERTCAWYDGGHYSWVYMRGVWTWRADTPTIRVNYGAAMVKACQWSLASKTNMISHETGHYFGLSHATGITVMTAGLQTKYTVATYYDIKRINGRY